MYAVLIVPGSVSRELIMSLKDFFPICSTIFLTLTTQRTKLAC